ncbi:MAG: aldo/keto reductase [Pseudomonadales bacterium]|jgi:aryl-alcohol dehydrogenase-like predicted oxidoreductase
MIERIAFGRTGHHSSRVIFGAAAVGGMRQEKADEVLETVRAAGINHIDVARSYGEAELRLAPFLADHRDDYFLATKTGQRTGDGARRELEESLARMGIDQVDLIQLHNLTDATGWDQAMATDGALAALVRARDEGLVRFIGVTGHGTYAPERHLKSLERFDFDSVLVPYNYSMRQNPTYRADLEALLECCAERQVAVQTIKAIARRRWTDADADRRFSWYMPIRDPEALARAVAYVLGRPGIFLNTTSDATLLPAVFAAAEEQREVPDDEAMAADQAALGVEPLFVRGVSDDVRIA